LQFLKTNWLLRFSEWAKWMRVNIFMVNLRGVALKKAAGETTTEQDITVPTEEFLEEVTIGEPKQH